MSILSSNLAFHSYTQCSPFMWYWSFVLDFLPRLSFLLPFVAVYNVDSLQKSVDYDYSLMGGSTTSSDQLAQEFIQFDLENLQGQRLCDLSGKSDFF